MIRRLPAAACLLVLLVAITACAPPAGSEQPRPTPAPATTVPLEPEPTPVANDPGHTVAVRLANDLGQQLGVDVQVISVEPAEWPDGCLGLPAAGEACTEAVAPGYLVVLEVAEGQPVAGRYQYRTDADGSQTRLEASPVSPVLVWQREGGLAGFCDEVRIDAGGGVTVSSCGEVAVERPLTAEESAALTAWMDRFASFEVTFTDPATADALTVALQFRGRGREQAGVEVQEAITVFAAGLVAPAAEAAPLSASDQIDIYAAVIRQVYTKDHTFGESPNFPVVYLLAGPGMSPGGMAAGEAPVLTPEVQEGIAAALADLPAQWAWVQSFDEVPREPEYGRVVDGGALITVGPIDVQGEEKVHVEGSVYVAPLVAGGQTYVVEKAAQGWEITGTTGPAWIS